ncbi:hypothetical protein [Algoriphagus litoralis]|uniref:hypothetical protein n=1 Tax=Algoriphagus litoralis TaxID=2202829 RepID=UPI000DBA3D66|nr:hypothetical protein [Algoriphagus litoralis]
MKDNESTKDIRAFFDQMKAADQNLTIPVFPEKVITRSIKWWIPVGIAATLMLGYLLMPQEEIIAEPPAEVIIITLQQDENHELQILIEEKTYLETWESPTSSLLAEY